MAGNDDPIEESVVRISPDLTGFRAKLDADLQKALRGVNPTINVKLVADANYFNDSARAALKKYAAGHKQPEYKIKLVADTKGFNGSADAVLKKFGLGGKQPTIKVKVETEGGKALQEQGGAAKRLSTDMDTLVKKFRKQQGELSKARREGAALFELPKVGNLQKAQNYVLKLREKFIAEQSKLVRNGNEQFLRDQDRALGEQLDSLARGLIDRAKLQKNGAKATQDAAEQEHKALGQQLADVGRQFDLQRAGQKAADKAFQDRAAATKRQRDEFAAAGRKASAEQVKAAADQAAAESRTQKANLRHADFERGLAAELSKIRRGDAEDEITIREDTKRRVDAIGREGNRLRIATLSAAEKIERNELAKIEDINKKSAGRRSSLLSGAKSQFGAPKLIDLGGEGARPMTVLIGAIAALTPALFSMSAAAVQASTSVVALGSAGIGAALGIGALTVSFAPLITAYKLHKSVLAQQATATENSTSTALKNAAEELRTRNSLIDSQQAQLKAEKDLHDARVQAAQDLVDMRRKVADLQNQQREDTVSLAEAEANRAAVNRNFFATALDRARANQDVNNARTKLADTGAERKKAQQDLATGVKKGVEGSDKVVQARDQLRQARERRAEALADAKSGTAASRAAGKVSSPMAQLNQQIKDMSPAGQKMFYWLAKNEGEFKRLRNVIQQATLPGFQTFLEQVTNAPKGKNQKSTLQILAEDAGQLGGEIGKVTARAGKMTREGWFRQALGNIQSNNVAATRSLGNAGLTLIKPVMQLLSAASPIAVKLSKVIEHIANVFANWIDKSAKNGSLKKWFDDAWHNATTLFDIVKNLGTVLGNIFKLSLPSGTSLLEKLDGFTKRLADWSASGKGKAEITKLFDTFRDLPYGKIRDFLVQGGIFLGAVTAAKTALSNPFWTFLGTFALSHPDAATGLMKAMTEFMVSIGTHLAGHTGELTVLLGIIEAAKAGKVIKMALELPGVGALKNLLRDKFAIFDKFLGGAKTATMTVQAGVVNLYGAAGAAAGAAGAEAGVLGGAAGRTTALGEITSGALRIAGGVFAASMAVDVILGKPGEGFAGLLSLIKGPKAYEEWSKENAPGFQRFFTMTLPGWLTDGGKRGWSSFKDAFINTFGAPAAHWFSITLPNALNLGSAGSGGWAGLATNLGHWFSTTLPEGLSGGTAHDWSGLGSYTLQQAKDFIGLKLPEGIQSGIDSARSWLWDKVSGWAADFWAWLKKLFGVASPSTITAEIGTNLVEGLWGGFTAKWTAIYKDVTKWIGANITDPLTTEFSTIGEKLKNAFVNPFDTLATSLATPLKKAFDWLDTNFITRLNVMLKAVGLPGDIPLFSLPDAATGTSPGAALGRVINVGAGLLTRADGGPVPGSSPHSKADNIPAMLTADEYVQPVDAVKHYGVGFMEAIRTKRFPKYADGGLVGGLKAAVGDNFITKVIGGALKGVTLKSIVKHLVGSIFGGGGGSAVGDVGVAEAAEAAARALGATDKQLVALIEAGIVESGLRNLNYGDRDSIGFLQQRPSQGWGTRAQIMDVAHATRSFITRAQRADQPGQTPGQLAQAVQRSAFPDRYDQREADAVATINRFAPLLANAGGGATVGGPTQASLIDFGHWLQARGYQVTEHPAFGGVHGHVRGSKHYLNRAIDVNHGAGTSAAEQEWLSRIIPEAHRRGFHTIFKAPGHYDHAHIDFANGGLVPRRKYDTGGTLPPGYTLAFNGTGRNETVRTASQEQALSGPIRLDRRDILALARHIAGAASPTVHMDGRQVAEITNTYTYLPAGV